MSRRRGLRNKPAEDPPIDDQEENQEVGEATEENPALEEATEENTATTEENSAGQGETGQPGPPSAVPQPAATQSNVNAALASIFPRNTPDELVNILSRRLRDLPPSTQMLLLNSDVHSRFYLLMNPALLVQKTMEMQAMRMQQMRQMPMVAPRRMESGDDDDEQVARLDSSEEAEFTSDEDEDVGGGEEEEEGESEAPPDDYVPPKRVVELRESRKKTRSDNDDWCFDEYEEEEESGREVDDRGNVVDRLERIYAFRTTKEVVEYLVKFQEAPPTLCQWVARPFVEVLPNGNWHLDRFDTDPIDINDKEWVTAVSPVAHRRTEAGEKPELLFRMIYDKTVMFYWDTADSETETKYFNGRISVSATSKPMLPSEETELPEPTSTLVKLREDSGELRDYQVEGVKWLINCWRAEHGSILADEMGLGKTIQLLAFLMYLNKHTDWHGPFIIAVRVNTFKQWSDEIERWTDMSYCPYQGVPAARALTREWQFPVLDECGKPIPNTFAFNILLVTYDVFLKDYEFLQDIEWQVVVLDEGHRIKNEQGKKNQLFTSLNARHKIILTGTPIQNSLQELWTLLRFVSAEAFEESPDFLTADLEDLTDDTVAETRMLISPHLLHRSLMAVERSMAPKEERVVFVGLTDVQADLIRLIKLHKVWRLKGVRQTEEEIDNANEQHLLFKVCSHPFLIPDAKAYYTKKLGAMKYVDLLLRVSTKFQWLDNVLRVLHRDGHRVLIFSQRVELLKLLDEFIGLRGYTKELLIGSMTDQEKTSVVEQYQKTDIFAFLISTRAGSEGLNLTAADTAIIFDPDWNPQNDIQAQARCHRIGQTQKVDVLRLCTYQTYEHEVFVRAQRKLGLWLTLLGSTEDDTVARTTMHWAKLVEPPKIKGGIERSHSLDVALDQMSTVVRDFSLECLDVLEAPLTEVSDSCDNRSYEEFIEMFPVVVESSSKRAKRKRYFGATLTKTDAERIYHKLAVSCFGKWDDIADGEEGHPPEQVRRLCVIIVVLSFRAVKGLSPPYVPILIAELFRELLDNDGVELEYADLVSASRQAWSEPFDEEFELNGEVVLCRKIRKTISEDPTTFLETLEVRLMASYFNEQEFNWDIVPPPSKKIDREILSAVTSGEEFDPENDRVKAIVDAMRYELISSENAGKFVSTDFWTEAEADMVIHAIMNYSFNANDPTEFHAKTRVLSKSLTQVMDFAEAVVSIVKGKRTGKNVKIPKKITKVDELPEVLAKPSLTGWTNLSVDRCNLIRDRMTLLELITAKVADLEQLQATDEWSDYHARKFLEQLLVHGIDSARAVILDKHFGLKLFATKADIAFLKGSGKRRNLKETGLPDYIFNDADLWVFVGGESKARLKQASPTRSPRKSPVKDASGTRRKSGR